MNIDLPYIILKLYLKLFGFLGLQNIPQTL